MPYQLSADKLHQDLQWALGSPDLMAAPGMLCEMTGNLELARWAALDKHKEKILDYTKQRSPKKLGIYFEVLWQYILEQNDRFDLIACNLPVRSDGETLGEFDFIYYCRQRQQYYHLETAVKFYLGIPHMRGGSTSWDCWIGPGGKDRLDLKLNKMLHRQSQLSKTPQGASVIAELGITQVHPAICLKGYFFYPLTQLCNAPKQAGNKHLTGYWLRISELQQLNHENFWQILSKEGWLAPASEKADTKLLNIDNLEEQLRSHFNHSKFPKMVVHLAPFAEGYRETNRYFVTPDNWMGS